MLVLLDWNGTSIQTEYNTARIVTDIANKNDLPAQIGYVFEELTGLDPYEKFTRLAKEAGRVLDEQTMNAMMDTHEERQNMFHSGLVQKNLFGGYLTAIHALTQQGHTIAICSNGNRQTLDNTIQRIGITDCFNDNIFTPDSTLTPAKPKPDLLLTAMAQLNAAPEETIMIGDSLLDMSAAKAAEVKHRIAFISHVYASLQKQMTRMEKAGATDFFTDHNKLPEMINAL